MDKRNDNQGKQADKGNSDSTLTDDSSKDADCR